MVIWVAWRSTSSSTVALNFAVTLILSCSIKFCSQVRQEDSPSVVPSWSSAKVLQLFRVLMENMTSPQKNGNFFFFSLCLTPMAFLSNRCHKFPWRYFFPQSHLRKTTPLPSILRVERNKSCRLVSGHTQQLKREPYCSLHEQNCCARNSFAIYNKNLQQHIRLSTTEIVQRFNSVERWIWLEA